MSSAGLRGIAWEDWGPGAFQKAASQKRPVLLHLFDGGGAPKLLDDAGARAAACDRYVAVLVHAAERPDIASCYPRAESGLLVLAADGRLVGPVATVEALSALADGASSSGADQPRAPSEVWTGAVGQAAPKALDPDAPAAVLAGMKAGRAPLDREFLFYAASEWKDAQAESRLLMEASRPALSGESPASQTAAALDAYSLTSDERHLKASLLILEQWIERSFDSHTGAFGRRWGGRTPLFCADANAHAAIALMRACAFAKGHRYRDLAEKVLIFLRHKAYDPLLGMIHCHGEGRPMVYGLLADNAWTMLAFTQAYLMSGHKPYREFADELARFLFQEFWEREHGGFLHRIAQKDDPPAFAKPRLYQRENAAAFEAVWRLAEIKGTANYRKWVELGLKSPLFGPMEGGFARVQDMLTRGRMDLEVVGRMDDPRTEELLTAVNRLYLPRKIVSFVDPDDQDYILAHKLEADGYPRLFACAADLRPVASTDDPREVPSVVAALRK